jgi:hypothetical protein
MASSVGLDVTRIVVAPGRVDSKAHWEFQKKPAVGTIRHYTAMDANVPSHVPWWFVLQIPADLRKGGYVLIQVLDYPRRAEWTPLSRTVINFAKATMPPYRGKLYAKIRLADPSGAHKYANVSWESRRGLAPYLKPFQLRPKSKVATTRGTDGDSLVAVVPRDDHQQMIRLFFATKVWPLHPGLPAKVRRALGEDGPRPS